MSVLPALASAGLAGPWVSGGAGVTEAPRGVTTAGESTTDLLEAVARQDRNAFVSLFHHFAPRVKSYLIRNGLHEGAAEDVMQEVMLTIWRRAPLYDRRQAAAATWIYTIARNKRIDRFRREKHPEVDLEDPALVPDESDGPDRESGAAQEGERLRQAMQDLPAEQLELLELHYFGDLSHSAIAEQLSLPLGTVKSRLRLAIKRLRAKLDEELGPGR